MMAVTVFFMIITILPNNDRRKTFWFLSALMMIISIILGIFRYDFELKLFFLAFEVYACSFTICWTIYVILGHSLRIKPILFGALTLIILSTIDYFFL